MNDKIVHGAGDPVKPPLGYTETSPAGRTAAAVPRTESAVIRIGINGLGRIGRGFLRLALERDDLQVVAVNDLAEPGILAHLLRHDSLAGRLDVEVRAQEGALVAGGRTIRCTRSPQPAEIPWSDVDVVLEATGRFTARAAASGHLRAGARRVVVTSPSADADLTVCYGVNHDLYDPARHRVLSNASCTTNAMAAVLAPMDAPHRDPRRARAAGLSMIPTSTTAAAAIARVMPGLAGKVRCLAVRVPTAAVSLIDLSIVLRRSTDLQEVRDAFRDAALGRLRGVLGYAEDELVSIDYLGDTRSAVIDAPLLGLDGGTFLKVLAWYDNERGYVHRLADLLRHMQGSAPPGERSS